VIDLQASFVTGGLGILPSLKSDAGARSSPPPLPAALIVVPSSLGSPH
jgi:hypothetical protein